jgi:hypothetical protein
MNDDLGIFHCLAQGGLIEQASWAELYGKPSDAGSMLRSVYEGANVPCAGLNQTLANPASDKSGGPAYKYSLTLPVHAGAPEMISSSDQGSGIRLR